MTTPTTPESLTKHDKSAPDPGLLYMIGHYEVHICVHQFDVDVLRSWLPPELELMDNPYSAKGKHPANLLFGYETEVEVNWTKWLPGVSYHEFGVVIPYVRYKDAKYAYNGPFLFTPIIFVDKDLISFGGEVVYGFPKRIGKFSVSDTAYAVLDTAWPSDYVRAAIADTNNQVQPEGRKAITNLLQQPSVSQKADGSWSSSGFWWNLDTAQMTDASVQGNVTPYYLPGLPMDKRPFEGSGSCDFTKGGAYKLVTDWSLTLPQPLTKDWEPWNGSGLPPIPPGEGSGNG
jgi:hypothetical protein